MLASTLSNTMFGNSSMANRAIDWYLVLIVLTLISIGIVMVASSSMDLGAVRKGDGWYHAKRHGIFLMLGCVAGILVFSVPMEIWNRYSILLLFLAVVLLALVAVPGIGHVVNGSRRWFKVGPINVQASEAAKFCFIVFFASFLTRKNAGFTQGWVEFFKLISVLAVFAILLLLEPDFGTTVVLCITGGAMMFVAGVPIIRFILLGLSGIGALGALAFLSPYRWKRLVTFLDPWAEKFDDGYQLVQSLIAFGRGEWTGLGLGNSLQKLFFLPEAHTDFVFAIIAEEFGLIGALILIGIFIALIWRLLLIAAAAQEKKQMFMSFVAYGIAVIFAAQAFINMGVASGLLPTKGLTLPFISYGGSSLIICCSFIALALRIDWELRR